MRLLVQWLIEWPERVAQHLNWFAPLFARITAGWVFLWSGWGKLNSLPQVTENFIAWGIRSLTSSHPSCPEWSSSEGCSCWWGCSAAFRPERLGSR
jgi:hypothetical protein